MVAALIAPAGGFYFGTTEQRDYEPIYVPDKLKLYILIGLAIVPLLILLILGPVWGTVSNVVLTFLLWVVGCAVEAYQKSDTGRVRLSQTRTQKLFTEINAKREQIPFPEPDDFARQWLPSLFDLAHVPTPVEPIRAALLKTITHYYAHQISPKFDRPPRISTSDINQPDNLWSRTTIPTASLYEYRAKNQLKDLDDPAAAIDAIKKTLSEILLPYIQGLPPAVFASGDSAEFNFFHSVN